MKLTTVIHQNGPLELDCEACGACCCNSETNRAHAFRDYVEVPASDALWKRQDRLFDLAVLNLLNPAGETHGPWANQGLMISEGGSSACS